MSGCGRLCYIYRGFERSYYGCSYYGCSYGCPDLRKLHYCTVACTDKYGCYHSAVSRRCACRSRCLSVLLLGRRDSTRLFRVTRLEQNQLEKENAFRAAQAVFPSTFDVLIANRLHVIQLVVQLEGSSQPTLAQGQTNRGVCRIAGWANFERSITTNVDS